MNDPHVVALHYELKFADGVSPTNAPPVEHETSIFHMRLSEGQVVFTFKRHFPTEAAARETADLCLRRWELHFGLSSGTRRMRFEFVKSEVIDRDPLRSGPDLRSSVLTVASASHSHSADTVTVIPDLYPAVPTDFVASPDVETLWHRYELYVQERESFLSMAYFCLSLLQWRAGGRAKAAARFAVDKKVLDRLGTLTSDYGDEQTARKLDEESTLKKLTGTQPRWIDEVVRRLIRRAGEAEWADKHRTPVGPQLTMATFITLDPAVPLLPRRGRR